MSPHPADSLSPEKLQLFVTGLSGLAPEEIRKAKVLYLRNAISEYEALQSTLSSFGVVQGCFAIIPLFWPVLWAQRRMMGAQTKLGKDRIVNAIDVWRSELRGERFELDGETIVV